MDKVLVLHYFNDTDAPEYSELSGALILTPEQANFVFWLEWIELIPYMFYFERSENWGLLEDKNTRWLVGIRRIAEAPEHMEVPYDVKPDQQVTLWIDGGCYGCENDFSYVPRARHIKITYEQWEFLKWLQEKGFIPNEISFWDANYDFSQYNPCENYENLVNNY